MQKLFIILLILIATVTVIRTLGPLNAEEHDGLASEKLSGSEALQP
jgi:hypothetical protein